MASILVHLRAGNRTGEVAATGLSLPIAGLLLALCWTKTGLAAEPTHVVQTGETLSAIAADAGVTVDELRQWNELGEEVIRPGQSLVVGPDPDNDGNTSYVVAEADTLSCIAVRFHVSVDDLLRWNRGLDRNHIRAGEELAIRANEGTSRLGEPRLVDIEHQVAPGETLSGIAASHGVELEQLASANEIGDADRIRVGRSLVIARLFELTHVVTRGDSLHSIALQYGVEADDLRRWNQELSGGRLRPDEPVRVFRDRVPSESIGGAACGRLVHPIQLSPHPGYVIRDLDRSWATEETVSHIRGAFDAVTAAHPEAHRVRIHDLSLPEGGPMADHRSHQSGRDADIIYYQRRCDSGECPYRPVGPSNLDVETQWTLLEHWLRTEAAHLIFIDASLQGPLYEEARRRGATEAELRRWFQHPRSRRRAVGIIRHFPNHRDHLHVRFVCPTGDESCQ